MSKKSWLFLYRSHYEIDTTFRTCSNFGVADLSGATDEKSSTLFLWVEPQLLMEAAKKNSSYSYGQAIKRGEDVRPLVEELFFTAFLTAKLNC